MKNKLFRLDNNTLISFDAIISVEITMGEKVWTIRTSLKGDNTIYADYTSRDKALAVLDTLERLSQEE